MLTSILSIKGPKDTLKLEQFENFQSSNIVEKSVVNNSKGYIVAKIPTLNNLETHFFVKTVIQWNHLEESVVTAETVEGFRSALQNCY